MTRKPLRRPAPPRSAPSRARGLLSRLACAATALALACATEPPPPPPRQAPLAATPTFESIARTSERPTRAGGALRFGEATDLARCAYDREVFLLPAASGLLLRFLAPVPTDLGLQLDTAQGPRKLKAPADLDDELRLAQAGRAYFYEDERLSRAAPDGAVARRQVALWPGERAGDLRFDVVLWDISFAPLAVGSELQSASMRAPLVGRCPDFTLALNRDAFDLRRGEARRIHATLTPSGDPIRAMTTSYDVTGAPAGLTISQKPPDQVSADWITPRELSFDVAAGASAPLGPAQLVLHARLGALEHTAKLTLDLLPKDDY